MQLLKLEETECRPHRDNHRLMWHSSITTATRVKPLSSRKVVWEEKRKDKTVLCCARTDFFQCCACPSVSQKCSDVLYTNGFLWSITAASGSLSLLLTGWSNRLARYIWTQRSISTKWLMVTQWSYLWHDKIRLIQKKKPWGETNAKNGQEKERSGKNKHVFLTQTHTHLHSNLVTAGGICAWCVS